MNDQTDLTHCFAFSSVLTSPLYSLMIRQTSIRKKYKAQFLSNQMKLLSFPPLQNCSCCSDYITSRLSHDFSHMIFDQQSSRGILSFSISSILTSPLYSLMIRQTAIGKKMSEVQFLTNQIKRPSFPPLQNCSCCSNYITSRLSHDFSHVKFDRQSCQLASERSSKGHTTVPFIFGTDSFILLFLTATLLKCRFWSCQSCCRVS